MSVCSQMGNGDGNEDKKKKKEPELENGYLRQEGSELFHQDRSKRRNVVKSLAQQHGTTSRDCDNGELNSGCQADGRNASDLNHVSPNEAKQGNSVCTLQSGEDPVCTFSDSSLASDPVTDNKSDKVCGDHVTGATADPELVTSSMSTGDATGNVVGNVPVDNPRNAPVYVSAYDSPTAVPDDVPGNVPDDVETPGDISGICAPSGVVPKHAMRPNQTVPTMGAAQKKTPTIGEDISSEPDKTRSESILSSQSSQPTPPSKIESSSPTPMQLVSGVNHTKSTEDHDTENLKGRNGRVCEIH